MKPLDPEFLAILACPSCRAKLIERESELVCSGCGLRYPVRDGVPILLVSEAQPPQDPGAP